MVQLRLHAPYSSMPSHAQSSMPALAYLKSKLLPGDRPSSHSTQKTYYLTAPPPHSNVSSSSTAAVPPPQPQPPLIPLPSPHSVQPIPPSSLLFCLTHPPPSSSSPTDFFLECLPDPIGFLYHSAVFIRRILASTPGVSDAQELGTEGWRHQLIELELEDKPGLAATSGGKIAVSLHWVGEIERDVKEGRKRLFDATREFKGVLLHELVHTIQRDAHNTAPTWLIESLADYCRLLAHLDPPHWRKPGQADRDKGWERAYDVGARFLAWLTGWDEASDPSAPHGVRHEGNMASLSQGMDAMGISSEPATSTAHSQPAPAQATQYPSGPQPPAPAGRPGRQPKIRRGPWPEFVKVLDERMKYERWEDAWWEELTGVNLERLWQEYLEFYA